MLHIAAAHLRGADLVDKKNAGSIASGRLEDLVQILLAVTDPHIEDVVKRDADEAGIHLNGPTDGVLFQEAAPIEGQRMPRLPPKIRQGPLQGN